MSLFCKNNRYDNPVLFSSLLILIIFISSLTLNSNFSKSFLMNGFMFSDIVTPVFGNQIEDSKQQSIEKFKSQFCGINSKPNFNQYVKEIKLMDFR